MNDGFTTGEDGSVTIDMNFLNTHWDSLDPSRRAALSIIIFERVLQDAIKMHAALEAIAAKCEQNGSRPEIAAIARDSLRK